MSFQMTESSSCEEWLNEKKATKQQFLGFFGDSSEFQADRLLTVKGFKEGWCLYMLTYFSYLSLFLRSR